MHQADGTEATSYDRALKRTKTNVLPASSTPKNIPDLPGSNTSSSTQPMVENSVELDEEAGEMYPHRKSMQHQPAKGCAAEQP